MKSDRIVIELSALHVERDAVILDRIDWQVRRGENWAILGANGSGKTSMLRALTGYLPPTSGQISVLGETYGRFDWRVLRERIGLVSSSVHQMMDDNESAVRAVISGRYAQIGYWGGVKPRDRRDGLAILRRVEAITLRDRPWRHLSQGERQRVLIGRALMAAPKLLILDEPCAGLDPVARERFLQFLTRLARRRSAPTMVLVTHHVEEIVALFSHVIILKSGSVLAAGPRARVLNSRNLSIAFDAPVRLANKRGRYSLTVRPASELVM
ncbi:MAG: ATP-binding cassette domain-containing protein [Candidatus Binatus sp.]|uniref:ABC transporter ATP-binding protein n=1 Tax=Candidatus Binatus sp. TaxID=2811406 RepID=UPI00271C7CA2|nr:ATP-binding cassette domain-containing protein [Candidatus Binatus sp.]MDO8433519.1 ATP-binding cassette domain-containing protein [Candidatus Binatus sp.]